MPNEVTLVGEAVAGESAKARAQLEALIESVNRSNFDIADLCLQVERGGDYGSHSTFREYYETLNIKARKIQYLTRMAKVMDIVGIERKVYEPLGIAKLREITSLDPNATWVNPETKTETPMREFIIGFVEKGNEIDLNDLKIHVRTLKGFIGERDLVWRNLCFTRLVAEMTWDPAIALAKNHLGSVGKDDEGISQDASDAAAGEVIAADYLNNPANNVLPEEASSDS